MDDTHDFDTFDTSVVGNTNTDVSNTLDSGRQERKRRWCFTVNNWTPEIFTHLTHYFGNIPFIIGQEEGDEKHTPHLQGYVEFNNTHTLTALKHKLGNQISWRWCRGSREQNIDYCSKQNVKAVNILKLPIRLRVLEQYKGTIWKKWQSEILEICCGPRNDRIVYWYWEPCGAVGKTYLARYIYCRFRAVLATGARKDVYSAIKLWMDKGNQEPEVILCDITRKIEDKMISYTAIEQLKDRLFLSTKYEPEAVLFEYSPHIVIFSNREPEYNAFSEDRWVVRRITPDGETLTTRRPPF